MRKLLVPLALFPDEENECMVNIVFMGEVFVNMAIVFAMSFDSLMIFYGRMTAGSLVITNVIL